MVCHPLPWGSTSKIRSSAAACGTGWECHSTAPVIAAQSATAQRTPLETTRWGVEATGTGLLATTPSATSCSSLPGLRPWHQRERLPVWYPTPNPGWQTYSSPPRAMVAPRHWTSPSSPLSSSRPCTQLPPPLATPCRSAFSVN